MTRPGSNPIAAGTPYAFRTRPPWSASSVNGSRCLLAKPACRSVESELIPITSAPASVNVSWLSRKAHASAVQPGVLSLG